MTTRATQEAIGIKNSEINLLKEIIDSAIRYKQDELLVFSLADRKDIIYKKIIECMEQDIQKYYRFGLDHGAVINE